MQNSHNDIDNRKEMIGALLAGGNSRRMGQDKALLELQGRPLWQRCLQSLALTCSSLRIAGDRPDLASAEVPSFADIYPGSSLAGLHNALIHADSDWVTVLPCDLPYPSPQLLRVLQQACTDDIQAVVPRTLAGREPLIACYRQSALPQIIHRLESGQPKILDLLDELEVRYLDEPELPSGWRRALRNINSPDDVKRLLQPPPAISVIANSGTGKTTLLEKLIAELSRNGWRVGALKHDSHKFEIDHEGKDSWRLTRAGAALTTISSPAQTATIRQNIIEPSLAELLAPFRGEVDLILTEGFRRNQLPKIEVHRTALGRPLLSRGEQQDPTLIAVASDAALSIDVPLFDLNDAPAICKFIEENFLQ